MHADLCMRKLCFDESVCFQCDGVALNLDQGESLQGLALLNIPYTHGGTNMWGDHLSRKRAKKLRKRRRNEDPNPTADLEIAVQGKTFISISLFFTVSLHPI